MWYEKYFEIVSKLSRTQMSEVFIAIDKSTGEKGVLKVVGKADPHLVKRLKKEAQILSKVEHPGVAKLKKVVEDEEGIGIFIEYVDGVNLRDIIGGGLPFERAIKITIQLLDVLGYIHSKGIVHRDIKPSNILLRRSDNSVVVIDFGISYFKEWERITRGFIGTPYYSSPEQIAGEKAKPSMDIYSVGATLYAMLAGEPPFLASLSEAIAMKLRGYYSITPITKLRDDVPQEIDNILAKALQPDPARRYKSCAEFKRDIEGLLYVNKNSEVKLENSYASTNTSDLFNKISEAFRPLLKFFKNLTLKRRYKVYFDIILWFNGEQSVYRIDDSNDGIFLFYDMEYNELYEDDSYDWNIAVFIDRHRGKPFVKTNFPNSVFYNYLKNKKWLTVIPERLYIMSVKRKEVEQ